MNILFVMEKWCDCNPDCGLSGTHHFYRKTWDSLGWGSAREFNYDNLHPSETIPKILEMVNERIPDVVFYTECWGRESATGLQSLWPTLADRGIPVVSVWHDTARNGVWRDLDGIALNVVVDLPTVKVPLRNAIALWVPQNPNLYFTTSIPRDIDAMHAGSRAEFMKPGLMGWIAEMRHPILMTGGPREDRLSWSEYAALYRRAKISVNFCKLPDGASQVKCRVWESIHSGAMLLEEANSETSQWLSPGVEYVEFQNQADCADKIRHYLANPKERIAIASAGHSRAVKDYSAEIWWKRVLNKLGLQLSEGLEKAVTGQYD